MQIHKDDQSGARHYSKSFLCLVLWREVGLLEMSVELEWLLVLVLPWIYILTGCMCSKRPAARAEKSEDGIRGSKASESK